MVCCPKTGAALGLAPKAGGCEGAAVNGEPNVEPNEGVWLAPKPPEDPELNTNGEGVAEGAEDEAAGGAAAPKLKEGAAGAAAAALAGAPKINGWAEAAAGVEF